jgi:hypothetical protein
MKSGLAMSLLVSASLTALGADFRLSFLDQKPVLDDTCQLLGENGFSGDSVARFRRLVEEHDRPGNRVDRSRFPTSHHGYYAFGGFADFTNRMSCGFSEAPGDNSISQNTLMCFDVVCLLLKGAGCDAPRLEDDFGSKGFVSVGPDGGLTAVEYKEFYPAVGVLSPTNIYEWLVGRPRSEAETKMGLSLRAKRRLPPDFKNTDQELRSVFAARIREVKNDGFEFPRNCEVGLGLVVNPRLHYVWADHSFICLQKNGWFICVEKNGPKGPYVRVEFKTEEDLARYMSWDLLLDAANPQARDYGSSVLISLNDRLVGVFRPNTP